jgi:SRSO17 transposase
VRSYLSHFQGLFSSKTKSSFSIAQKYVEGLFRTQKSNVEEITNTLPDVAYHQMQHFITDAKWDARPVIDQAAAMVSEALPKRKLTGLLIDETGTEKKGEKSVGVGWQYCGNVGKTANSQVSVMACLSNGDFASLVDARLYLPKSWTNDPKRCKKAGIPEEERQFKTKPQMALDIVKHQLAQGVEFDFVGADALYGNNIHLGTQIEELGLTFMMDVHKGQHVFLEKPDFVLPEKHSNKGRKPKRSRPNTSGIRVDEYCDELSEGDWQNLQVRNTAKGVLQADFHFREIYVWDKEANEIYKRLLVIRKELGKKETKYKYSLTNANLVRFTEEGIAYMQAQRYFVEHSIKESKDILGMNDYQTRKWRAWQHQVAINIMVMCFLLKEKLHCFDSIPLLSARDIKEWVEKMLFTELSDDDLINLMLERHKSRQKDINRAHKKPPS